MKSVLERVEIIVGKGENAGYQHFLLFPLCFQKFSFAASSKSGLCGKRLNTIDVIILTKKKLQSLEIFQRQKVKINYVDIAIGNKNTHTAITH